MRRKGARRLLPAHDRAPLVVLEGQVAPGLHPLRIHRAEDGLAGGAHGQALLQGLGAALGDPGDLGREALDVIGLLEQQALGDQHGHGHVLVASRLEAGVQLLLDQLPDAVAVGLDRHAAAHGRVVHQVCLQHDVGIPLREVLAARGDVLDELLIVLLGHRGFLLIAVGKAVGKEKNLRPMQGRRKVIFAVPPGLARRARSIPLTRGDAGVLGAGA